MSAQHQMKNWLKRKNKKLLKKVMAMLQDLIEINEGLKTPILNYWGSK